MAAIIGLLTSHQANFVDKFSQLVIRESSNMEETTSDDQLSDFENDMRSALKMTCSTN